LNELGSSIEKGNEIIRIDSKNVKAYFRLCLAYEKRGDLEEAWDMIKASY